MSTTMLLILVILAFAAPIAAYVSTRPCKDDLFVFRFFRRKEEAKWEWEACADILDDVILIYDVEHRIQKANRAAAERLNINLQDIIGKKCSEIYPESGGPNPYSPDIQSPNKRLKKSTVIAGDGIRNIFFEITTYPLFEDGRVSGFIHYMKDITLRNMMENALTKELLITKTLHETDKSILSITDRRELLKRCITNCSSIIDADYISITTYDKEVGSFRLESYLFKEALIEGREIVPFRSTVLKRAVSSNHVLKFNRDDFLEGDGMFIDKGLKGLMTVPLTVRGEPVGSLNIGTVEGDGPDREEVKLAEKFALQVAMAVDSLTLCEKLQKLFINTIVSLSSAIDAKNTWTRCHSERVARYALAISGEIGVDKVFMDDLRLAVMLHDIGKIGISDEILNKEEQLTDEEKRLINEHPVKGAAILEPIDELNRIIPIIRHHHEHWDGSGYPDGLSGNEIPLGARILSVADAFDAMISDRPYRQRYSPAAARREIINCSGAYFDPQAVGAFIMAMERHGLGEELSEEYGI